jgi:hypothetical protein
MHPRAPESDRGPRGSGPQRLARQRRLWCRGEGSGPSQEGDGEVTGHRGSRAAAGGSHKKEIRRLMSFAMLWVRLLLPCPWNYPWACSLSGGPVRGRGVGAEGRRLTKEGR